MPLVSSIVPRNTQRLAGLERQRISSMDSIIVRFSETMLLLETEGYPTITSRIIMILHSGLPWNADSFIHPLVRELLELAIGMSTYDALSSHLFALHAYVITAFGDIPAISMLMHMKGHNSRCPCRMCGILGIRIPDLQNKMLYMPLSRCNHPAPTDVVEYCPEKLPLRSHNSFMAQAKAVESAPTKIQREGLAKTYGIKGVPLLSALGSLRFPQSF